MAKHLVIVPRPSSDRALYAGAILGCEPSGYQSAAGTVVTSGTFQSGTLSLRSRRMGLLIRYCVMFETASRISSEDLATGRHHLSFFLDEDQSSKPKIPLPSHPQEIS